eukprot:CAMPEP_0113502094 /NCGR_PEP_ID=MMETSP0014_2-20120614/33347_1 /TAXON_ID=2857 /ORGANISM="Nitzschia sp." /LENGTH=1686 /DNA_ID=CAMNT_0000396811 /DNA_START=191 /DNA_END=5250 /DNA_ORIENTATION=+ /assembly_acc=CAM_ASM_000159
MSSVEENATAVSSYPSSDQDAAAVAAQESSGGESDNNGGDIYQHNNYVYILDKEFSWVPAMVTERINETTMNLSIPKYKTEQAILCDGGRTASRFEKQTIDLNDPKTVALYPNKHLPLQNVNHEGELQVVEDMVDLPFLHEAAILYNLKRRHITSLPYTRVADIVIAVNPYQWFHHLYSEKERTRYSQALVWDPLFRQTTSSSSKQQQQQSSSSSSALDSPKAGSAASSSSTDAQDPRTKHPPHVYETSCLAYKGDSVSGESGAGKTETVKILLRNLASIQDGGIAGKNKKADPSSPAKDQQPQQDNIIVQRVLDSNPLLEAFGNATTIRNDNSSRFGKYLQLQFDSMFQGGSVAPAILAGSKCEVYLLEKSRVTHHDPSERTYHIFYQLLSAPEELKVAIWDGLADTDAESFCYVGLTESDSPSAMGIIEGKTDAERFQQTLEALEIIGVKGAILQMLLRAICVVLQLGNLEFAPASIPQGNSSAMTALGLPVHHPTGGNSDASEISSLEELQDLSSLMGMNDIDSSEDGVSNTLQAALTVRTVEARGEVFAVPLTPEKAKESADAFAKEIYAKTFLWLVRTINDATCAEKNYSRAGTQRSVPLKYSIIGLLDIFGFETFETNRFEQLCINYCNEKLQQKFTQDIFRSVQIEYENEGIELGEITYDDNTDALDLVEGRMGLLAFLNEECVRPKGSDKTFVYKSEAMNKENPCFFRDKHARDTVFGIRHYAGPVVYDATGFVVKNTDTLPSDLMDCAKLSSNEIISKEITNESMMNPLHINSVSSSGATKKKRPKSSQAASSNPKELQKRTSNIVAETVWTKFKNQLSSLMVSLSTTKTRYIRCIKPNSQKAPLLMEHASTVDQLRCAGVVAAVTISRSAFPNRLEHMAVLDRFKSLWPKGGHLAALQDQTLDPEERRSKATEILLTIALKDMEFEKNGNKFRAFVMGRTRAYFRSGALEFLEAERLKHLGTYATIVQRNARRYIVQSKYRRHRAAVIKLQARYRRLRQQTLYKRLRDTSIRVQCWYRIIFAKRAIFHLRRKVNATKIQTRWRTTRDSKRFRSMVSSVVVIQAMVRGSLQRPKYRQALIDKAEQAKLENQLTALQRKLEEAETKRLEAEKAAEERAMAAVAQYKEEQKVDDSFQDAVEEEEDSKANENAPSSQTAAGPADQSTVVTQEEEAKDLSSDQQQLMDESSKMLEYLRKEVFKLRSQNQQLKTDFDLLKDNNQRLMDANASAGASFAALNQHAKQLSKQNAQIGGEVHSFKEQTQKLNVMLFELKEELKMKNATYAAEVQSRLQYQKALQKITDMITDSCRDHRLVERVLKVADDVEMDLMSTDSFDHGGTNLDTDDDEDGAIFHLRRKVNATKIQTRWRTTRDSKRFRSMVSSAIVVQAMVRGSLQRPKYRQALIDKAEQAKLENQLTALQRKLEEAETKRLEAEKAAEERAMAAVAQYKEEQKVDDSFQDAVEEEEDSKANENAPSSQTAAGPADQSTVVTQEEEAKDLSADQQQLMDESSKMLEYLRKEVFKLRSQNQQLKTDFDLLKDNNQRLMDANASAGASFAALNQHAKQLSKQNAQIGGEVHSFKEQTQKLNVMLFELKEELKMKNATYAAEVQSRLQYQKALQKITDMITDSCRDHRLVERVLKVADDVEADLMSTDSFDHGGTNVDTDDDEDVQNQGSRSG